MAPTLAVPAFDLSSDTLRYLHQVLVDGRYVDQFHRDPARTARCLGVPLSGASASALSELPPAEALTTLYRSRFRPDKIQVHPYIITPLPTAAIGCGVIVVGVVVAIVISVAAASAMTSLLGAKNISADTVVDTSEDRDQKV